MTVREFAMAAGNELDIKVVRDGDALAAFASGCHGAIRDDVLDMEVGKFEIEKFLYGRGNVTLEIAEGDEADGGNVETDGGESEDGGNGGESGEDGGNDGNADSGESGGTDDDNDGDAETDGGT